MLYVISKPFNLLGHLAHVLDTNGMAIFIYNLHAYSFSVYIVVIANVCRPLDQKLTRKHWRISKDTSWTQDWGLLNGCWKILLKNIFTK